MSDWDTVIARIDDAADARFRRRMVVEPVAALRDLGLAFPDQDRARLTEYANGVMASRGERVESATPDPGREAERDRLRQLPAPALPPDRQGVTVRGPLDTGAHPGPPIPTGASVTNPFPLGPGEIPVPLSGAPGLARPDHHPPPDSALDHAIDQARHPAEPLDPSLVHDPPTGLGRTLDQSGVDGLATAIAHLRGQTTGGDVVLAVILLFTATGDALHHDNVLVEERGEWARLHEYAGVPARFAAARDQVLAAADEVRTALVLWVGHPVPPDAARQFVAVLVHGSRQARGQLAHLTHDAVGAYTDAVATLAGAAADSASVAAALTSVLEHADRLFHDDQAPADDTVTAEVAAWLLAATPSGDPSAVDAARDQFVTAARDFAGSLDPHLDQLVDDATRGELLRPLVHAATLAREHLHH